MENIYDLDAYYYALPEENIAQEPAQQRDESRLLIYNKQTRLIQDGVFGGLQGLVRPGDLLVVNDTRVFPARLKGRKSTGGKVEFFMLEHPQFGNGKNLSPTGSEAGQVSVTGLLKSSKRPQPGGKLFFRDDLSGEVEDVLADGKVVVRLSYQGDFDQLLSESGEIPLPPYIRREKGEHPADRQRYQTVYARQPGAVAAPTAGLHFTEILLDDIRARNVGVAGITLHVGYGTFAPVREQDIRKHKIHAEYLEISDETANQINETKEAGGAIWAVGTTTVRALESASDERGRVSPRKEWCSLYIYPGYTFRIVDNLITNFHLPRSSLLFMVSAFAGREEMLRCYQYAVANGYRFYSYGDAMVILG